MKSSKMFFAALAVLAWTATVWAAKVDFNDPRRALGREDDVRVDAEIAQEWVSSNSPLVVTYQVENLSKTSIAIADKQVDVSFDSDSRTVTFAIGAEVPTGTNMPRLVVVKPGEKKTFTAMGAIHIAVPNVRFAPVPQSVQIKVNLLKDLTPFASLIAKQTATTTPPLPNDLFDQWVNSVDSVFLNPIPVRWNGNANDPMKPMDASNPAIAPPPSY